MRTRNECLTCAGHILRPELVYCKGCMDAKEYRATIIRRNNQIPEHIPACQLDKFMVKRSKKWIWKK